MTKASVLQWVDDLGRGRANLDVAELYYHDVAYELARLNQTVNVALISSEANTTSYAFPLDALDLIAVFYDDTELHMATARDMEAHSRGWRDDRGTPIDYVLEYETSNVFRLYPTPDVSAKDFIFLGSPLGTDYPEYTAAALYQQKRDDLPEYFDLYMAIEILSREFERESDHRDLKFATLCQQFGALLLRMVT